MTKKILIAMFAIGLFTSTAQANVMFGVNGGATWGLYEDPIDGSFEVPILGVHAIFGGKESFSLRTYLEYATFGAELGPISVTSDYVLVTALATFGNQIYIGVGPSYGIAMDDDGDSDISLALALGAKFTPNFFLEVRAASSFDEFLDSIPIAIQLGFSFGGGRS